MFEIWNPSLAVINKPIHDNPEMDVIGVIFPKLHEDGDVAENHGMWQSGLLSCQLDSRLDGGVRNVQFLAPVDSGGSF